VLFRLHFGKDLAGLHGNAIRRHGAPPARCVHGRVFACSLDERWWCADGPAEDVIHFHSLAEQACDDAYSRLRRGSSVPPRRCVRACGQRARGCSADAPAFPCAPAADRGRGRARKAAGGRRRRAIWSSAPAETVDLWACSSWKNATMRPSVGLRGVSFGKELQSAREIDLSFQTRPPTTQGRRVHEPGQCQNHDRGNGV